jgi:hypothetical protein
MGNGNSIRVETDRGLYQPGDMVNGFVHASILQPFNSDGVYIKAKGFERVAWTETHHRSVQNSDGTHRTETYHEHLRDQNTFFKVQNQLYNFPGGVAPAGQYSFPFAFQLPLGLPGSFSDNALPKNGSAMRVYKVKGVMHVRGMLKTNLKHTQILNVNEPLNKAIVGMIVEDTRNVTKCCCIGKGQATIKASLNKDCFIPGEQAMVIAELKNASSSQLPSMKLKLKREMYMTCRGKPFHHVETINETVREGLEPMTELVGDQARSIAFNIAGNRPMPSTTQGALIRNSYYLQVSLTVSWGSDIVVKLPVVIYPPQVQNWQPLINVAPPGWAPQIMPAVTFAVPYQGGAQSVPQQYAAPPQQYAPPQQHQQQQYAPQQPYGQQGGYQPPQQGGYQPPQQQYAPQPQQYGQAQYQPPAPVAIAVETTKLDQPLLG